MTTQISNADIQSLIFEIESPGFKTYASENKLNAVRQALTEQTTTFVKNGTEYDLTVISYQGCPYFLRSEKLPQVASLDFQKVAAFLAQISK